MVGEIRIKILIKSTSVEVGADVELEVKAELNNFIIVSHFVKKWPMAVNPYYQKCSRKSRSIVP